MDIALFFSAASACGARLMCGRLLPWRALGGISLCMDIFTWKIGGLGAMGIVALLVIVRLFRKGLGTYSQCRDAMRIRIEKTSTEIREYNQSIPEQEQARLLEASVQELLELAGATAMCAVWRDAQGVRLRTPDGEWLLRHRPKRAALRGVQRTLYGAGTWEACPQVREGERVCDDPAQDVATFTELTAFMAHVDGLVRRGWDGGADAAETLPCLRHRVSR